jgi:hypothetical protein
MRKTLSILSLVGLSAATGSATLIDDFATGFGEAGAKNPVGVTCAGSPSAVSPASNALGGARTLSVNPGSGPAAGGTFVGNGCATISTFGGGTLSVSDPTTGHAEVFQVSWTFPSQTLDSNYVLFLAQRDITNVVGSPTVQFYWTSTPGSGYIASTSVVINSSVLSQYAVNFPTVPIGAQEILMVIRNLSDDTDMQFQLIQAVPEPATFGMAAAALITLGLIRRRRA